MTLAVGKEPAFQCRRHDRCRSNPWLGKISWMRAWQPTPEFLPGGAWWATVHWVEKSWTPLKQLRMHARTEDQLNNRHCRQGKWKLEICHTQKNQTRNANLKYWCLEDFMTYWMWVKKKREVSSTFLAQASGWVASRINQNRDYRRRCIFWWQDAGGDDKMFILGQWIMRVEICIRRTIATSSQLKIQNWVSYRKTRW